MNGRERYTLKGKVHSSGKRRTWERSAAERDRGRSRPGGFTLIETVVSIVIVLITVAGLFAIFATSIAPSTAPQPYETTIGAQYVREGLERVYADRRNISRNFAYIVSANYPSESLGSGYVRTTAIGAWPFNADTATFRQVTVQVTHNGRLVAQGVGLVANYAWN